MKKLSKDQVIQKLHRLDDKAMAHTYFEWDGWSRQANEVAYSTKAMRIHRRMDDIQKRYEKELVGTEYEYYPNLPF